MAINLANLMAVITEANGVQQVVALAELAKMKLVPGMKITLIDKDTGKAVDDVVAKKEGEDLVIELRDGAELARIDDFYAVQQEVAVISAEEAAVAGGAAEGSSSESTYTLSADGESAGISNTALVLGGLAVVGLAVALDDSDSSTSSSVTTSSNGGANLTAGYDSLTGSSGNDTFNAYLVADAGNAATVETLSAFDSINGGAGTDTLNYHTDNGVALPAVSLSSVEVINIVSGAGVTANLSSAGFSDVTTLSAYATGGAVDIDTRANVTSVTVTGTATTVAINDNGSSSTQADTLATVSITGATGSSAIATDALTSLTLTDIQDEDADVTVTAASGTRTLAVTLNDVNTDLDNDGGAQVAIADNTATTVNMSTTGVRSENLTVNFDAATTMTIAADEAIEIEDFDASSLATLTISGDSNVTITFGDGDVAALATGTVTAASATGVIAITAQTDDMNLDTDDDVATTILIGGSGSSDTLTFANNAAIDVDAAAECKISGFETITFANTSAAVEFYGQDDMNDGGHVTFAWSGTFAAVGTFNMSAQDSNGTGFTIIGGTAADSITGGAGNDYIGGHTGNDVDTLIGGAGNDTYLIADEGEADVIVEAASGGTDTLYFGSSLSLEGVKFGTTAAGSSADAALAQIEQVLIAAGATATFDDDQVDGQTIAFNTDGAGVGTIAVVADSGGATVDLSNFTFATINYTNSSGVSTAGTAMTSADAITVTGNSGDDTITAAGTLAHSITGAAGADLITLGSGADTVVYTGLSSSVATDGHAFDGSDSDGVINALTEDLTESTASSAGAGDYVDGFVVGTDVVNINGDLEAALEASGATTVLTSAGWDFNAAGIIIVDDSVTTVADFGDLSAVAVAIDVAAAGSTNATNGDEFIIVLAATGNASHGIYYFKDADAATDLGCDLGDSLGLIGIVELSAAGDLSSASVVIA